MSIFQIVVVVSQSHRLVRGAEGNGSRVTGALDTWFERQLAAGALSEGCFYLSI